MALRDVKCVVTGKMETLRHGHKAVVTKVIARGEKIVPSIGLAPFQLGFGR